MVLDENAPLANLRDYTSILTSEKFVAALPKGFVDAQTTCAQLGMKPMKSMKTLRGQLLVSMRGTTL